VLYLYIVNLIPGNDHVKEVSEELRKNGFDVKPILSRQPLPQEHIRICLHSFWVEIEKKFVANS
jgi:8-amino-7-oxononanoate synthase